MHDDILTQIEGKDININFVENLPYNPALKSRAKRLRKGYNYAEVVFWLAVKKKQFYNIDFDRQRIIDHYIVDFLCKKIGITSRNRWRKSQ